MRLFSFRTKQQIRPLGSNIRSALVITNRKKPFVLSAGALAFIVAPMIVSATQNDKSTQPTNTSSSSKQNFQTDLIEPTTTAPELTGNVSQSSEILTSDSNPEVFINGQHIELPKDGAVNQTIVDSSGSETNIQVRVNSQTDSSNSSSGGSSRVIIHSSSDSSMHIKSTSP
jgi:hypothetical protein